MAFALAGLTACIIGPKQDDPETADPGLEDTGVVDTGRAVESDTSFPVPMDEAGLTDAPSSIDAASDTAASDTGGAKTCADFEFAISCGVCVVLKLNTQTSRARQIAMKIAENC
jgi:hypothetical protein